MSSHGVRRRVACYVTRSTEQGDELLVFDHVDDDPAHPSGTQVPAGGMLAFEAIEEAALREIAEETGLFGLMPSSQLGGVDVPGGEPGGPSTTTYVHLTGPSEGPSEWSHDVGGDGADAGMTFACRWEPLPLDFELAANQGAFLSPLPA